MQRSYTELDAAKDAIERVCSGKHIHEVNDVMLDGICDFIVTAADPKAFAQSLCNYMDDKKISGTGTNYLYTLLQESELKALIATRKKNGRLDSGFSVETFEKNKAKILKNEEDDDKFRAAFQRMSSFSPKNLQNAEDFEQLTVGKLTVFLPKKR